MIYLAANNSRVHRLAAEGYPMGWMMSPAGFRDPRSLMFAIDNGLFYPVGGEPKGMKFLVPFYAMLGQLRERGWSPMFVVVPDVPYDGAASIEMSRRHLRHVSGYGFPTAIAVQDGMTPDVLDDDGYAWVFVAGSTEWKWKTATTWIHEAHARGMGAHIARVNTWRRIYECIDNGADSADGTGIWRGDKHQLASVLAALVQDGLWGQLSAGVSGGFIRRCA